MKKVLTVTLILILILSLVISACGSRELQPNDVESIILTVGGPKQKEYEVLIFNELENINNIIQAEQKLKKYNPNNDIKTWKLDIKIEYHLTNGIKVEKEYKGVRPVEEYIGEIYSSQEYKKQIIPLFQLDRDEKRKI